MTPFRVVVADPPWPMAWRGGTFRTNGRGVRQRLRDGTASVKKLPYATMTVDDIAAIDVQAVTAHDAVLFLWAPDSFVLDGSAAKVCSEWGFKPLRFIVWEKTGFGLGTFPRPQHELLLFGRQGKVNPNRRDVGSVHRWKFVYEKTGKSAARKHSAKPPGALAMIEAVFDGPYIELFAREARIGWTSYGDQVAGDPAIAAALNG